MLLTFEKIIEPVIPLIIEESNRLKNDKSVYKLSLYYFIVSLMYAVINKTQSIRLLINVSYFYKINSLIFHTTEGNIRFTFKLRDGFLSW
jgi:hypothetical protein